MKQFKGFGLFIFSLVIMIIISACGNSSEPVKNNGAANKPSEENSVAKPEDKPKEVKITFLNTKGEIQKQIEEAAAIFHQDYPHITVEILQTGAGQSPFERASSLYAAGNPAQLAMLDGGDVEKFKDRILDLSNEKWITDAVDNSLKATTFDGKVLAFPFAVEGYGFIYNKPVLDKAVGGSFDPSTIKTTKDLENLFKQIEASGKPPLMIAPMDWSLGAHYLALGYATQSTDRSQVDKFVEDLKAGSVDLSNNAVFDGLLDTFDVMKQYNIDKESPLSGTYERGPELLAKGEVGIWFMGNWAWPQISGFDTVNGQYGFLPVPISNNPDDFGNSEISAAVSKRIIVDKEFSTPEQIEAATTFLDWLVYHDNGQDFIVNKANIIPAFKNITLEAKDPLAKSIQDYIGRGKTQESMSTLPADHWAKTGASMQKYLAGVANREAVLEEIEDYWKSVK